MNVMDEIDSAMRAAETEEMILDDPRLQERVADSIPNAARDSMIVRRIRARMK